jgi:eukaryotic-like serine/threonine-protein kinase
MAQRLIDSAVNPIAARTLYLRGLNFLRAHKGTEAAAEFQTLLDHKGANWGPYYPAAYVGLARASCMVGDTHRGKKSYQDFLALWKEADAEIPLLIQARAEYAALK